MLRSAVDIGNIIQNAVVFNPRNWRDPSMNADALLQNVQRLFALLEERQIDYVLVGGIALLNYVKGRNTEDIDLSVALPALDKLPEIERRSQDLYFIRGEFQGLKIDALLTENPLFDAVQRRYATTLTFLDREIPIATPEGLLLLKLYALPSLYRQGDFVRVGIYENDIAALMYAYHPDMEALLGVLASYLNASDLASVREIVAEIEQRIQRFQAGRGD